MYLPLRSEPKATRLQPVVQISTCKIIATSPTSITTWYRSSRVSWIISSSVKQILPCRNSKVEGSCTESIPLYCCLSTVPYLNQSFPHSTSTKTLERFQHGLCMVFKSKRHTQISFLVVVFRSPTIGNGLAKRAASSLTAR